MPKCTISFKTDIETKEQAIKTCREIGMDISTAMNIFLRKFVNEGGMPFVVKVNSDKGAVPAKTAYPNGMRGALSQYANAELRQKEEGAWERAAVDKYDNA